MVSKDIVEKIESMGTYNTDEEGNIIPMFSSVVSKSNGKIEVIFYLLSSQEPVYKFELTAMGCDPKLVENLYKNLVSKKEATIKKKKSTLTFLNKTGSC